MEIRRSTDSDKAGIGTVHIRAFGAEEGPEIADLVNDLFEDETAFPLLSLVAVEDGRVVGHVLYTKVTITHTTRSVSAQILAPLGILPEVQKQGIGAQLIREGLIQLKESGAELVFVLGHPEYYPRRGFIPAAGALGFEAPYPIPEKNSAAWMVQELEEGIIGSVRGKVQCSDALNQPHYWHE